MARESSGINLGGVLLVVFITLKLTGYIDWSWWWVLSPIWLSLAVGAVVLAVFLAVWGVAALISTLWDRR